MNNKLDQKGITIKQNVRFGKPCIKGTRIAIADVLWLLQNGYDIEDVPKQYPELTTDDVKMAVRYASKVLGKEEVFDVQMA
jgi:uncharacterized protein (DUF433 family)